MQGIQGTLHSPTSQTSMEARALRALHTTMAPATAPRGSPEPSVGSNSRPRLRASHQPLGQLPSPGPLESTPSKAAGNAGAVEVASLATLPAPMLRSPTVRPCPLPLDSSAGYLRSCCRRGVLLWLASALALPAAPLPARARGLFQMPPARLNNRYFLVRAGESEYEREGVVNTNPVAKTSVDSGLSEEGKRQTVRSAEELQRVGACDGSCWIWPSITQRSYQAAEIIAALNGIDRSHIVPEYSFLDARGLGAYEGRSLDSISEVYASDSVSPNIKPPPIDDGTPNESVADVFVRVTQLMSIVETQYSGDTLIIVSPDSDNLSILQAGLVGLDLRRHRDLFFSPGEVRLVDAKSIPPYKQPASAVYKCTNPPSCR